MAPREWANEVIAQMDNEKLLSGHPKEASQ
jgi:hypothetical protein